MGRENDLAYRKLLESAGSVPEVGALIDEVRDRTSARILEGLGAGVTPQVRAAARAWLWFIDGAILDWLEHRDLDRAELGALLLGSLAGALSAAGAAELLPPPSARQRPSISFFQIGASALTRSMISRAPGEGLAAVRRRDRNDHARLRERHLPHAVLDGRRAQPVPLDGLGGDRRHALLGHLGVGLVLEPLHLARHAGERHHRAGARVAHALRRARRARAAPR